jgi:divalent metal cation (Fe/Co/Zn/Cd) transporter
VRPACRIGPPIRGGPCRLPAVAAARHRAYPYGLERAEDLGGIGLAAVIWASAAFAGYESIRKLLAHGPTTHIGAGIAGEAGRP